jgi:pimeloyl-ACP methyl ester carboxylesterase
MPFALTAGDGPPVVCLHANASSSGQWRGLMELLAPRFTVTAADSYDAGKSPSWPSDRVITLSDEAALIEPLLDAADGPVALVGHSFGGAVALMAALANPGRVRAIAIYEPTLFWLIDQERPAPNDADGIRDACRDSAQALDEGDGDGAAERFIDYWMGAGAWAATPERRRPAIAQAVGNIRRWDHALTRETTPASAFAALDVPVLLMTGGRSTASAHGAARLLASALPRVETVHFDTLGHMAPVTDPELVNAAIQRFLEENRPAQEVRLAADAAS